MSNQAIPQFAFTTKFNGLSNVIHNEVLIVSPRNIPEVQFSNTKARAIWDTGATNSCINLRLATELSLVPVSKRETNTANGTTIADVFIVDIILPNNVSVVSAQLTGLDLANGIDCLIGMDIINQGDFAITNKNGETIFSFRIPSVTQFDFVESLNSRLITNTTKKEKKKKRKIANGNRSINRKKKR